MKKYLFISFLLIPKLCFGAISAAVVWEVRTTGASTTAGCGFLTGASGTDRSQQDAVQTAFTDLVIGVTTTELTSAANPFGATDVGNIIRITSGTGFTVGYYEVISVAVVTATMDRAVGTGGSTGGVGNLGGACAGLDQVIDVPTTSDLTAGNIVYVKAGTYVESIALTTAIDGGNGTPIRVIGYNSTRSDEPTGANRPIFSGNNSLVTGITITDLDGWSYENLVFRSYTGDCISQGTGSSGSARFINVSAAWCSDGFELARDSVLIVCEANNNADDGVSTSGARNYGFFFNSFHDNTGSGVFLNTGTAGNSTFVGNAIFGNGDDSIVTNSGSGIRYAINNTIYGNTGAGTDGFNDSLASNTNTALLILLNNTSSANGQYAYNFSGGTDVTNLVDYSNYFGHATELNNVDEGQFNTGDSDPLLQSPSADLSLQNTSPLLGAGLDFKTNMWTYTGGDPLFNIGSSQDDATTGPSAGQSLLLLGVTAQ